MAACGPLLRLFCHASRSSAAIRSRFFRPGPGRSSQSRRKRRVFRCHRPAQRGNEGFGHPAISHSIPEQPDASGRYRADDARQTRSRYGRGRDAAAAHESDDDSARCRWLDPATPAATPVVAAQPVGPPRDSLLQHPAKPAEVTVVPGSLTIKADNSSLSQILQEISKSTGMKVDGLGQDERIFGSYGPGDPRESCSPCSKDLATTSSWSATIRARRESCR